MDDPVTPSRDVSTPWPFCAKVSRIKASALTTSPVMLISPVHRAHRGRLAHRGSADLEPSEAKFSPV